MTSTLRIGVTLSSACALLASASPSAAASAFRFEAFPSLEEMKVYASRHFPVGTSRDEVRSVLVGGGRSTLKTHPSQAGVEKYVYDLNLCGYYVWRWNISADYTPAGRLKQLYVNGEPALADGAPPRQIAATPAPGRKQSIYRMQRPRPEAYRGEKSLGFLVYDLDSNLKSIDDQKLMGSGPSRADPANLGRMHVYKDVEPWRSIFDFDPAKTIAPYPGDCAKLKPAMGPPPGRGA